MPLNGKIEFLLGATLAGLIACAPKTQDRLTAEGNAVRQEYAAWTDAEKRRDLAATMRFLAPDVVVQAEGAPARIGINAASTLWAAFFKTPYTDIVNIEPRSVVVSQSGDIAYDTGSWKILMPVPAGTLTGRGKSIIVWKKIDGAWKVAAYAYSMDSAAARARGEDLRQPLPNGSGSPPR